jgi:hypothetical protein
MLISKTLKASQISWYPPIRLSTVFDWRYQGNALTKRFHTAQPSFLEHDDRHAFEVGPKHTFAGDVEVVAVDQPEDFFHDSSQGVEWRVSQRRRREVSLSELFVVEFQNYLS